MVARTISVSDSVLAWVEDTARATERTVDAVIEDELLRAEARSEKVAAALEYTLAEYPELLKRLAE